MGLDCNNLSRSVAQQPPQPPQPSQIKLPSISQRIDIFPLGMKIVAELVLVEREPVVVLRIGARELERYPLRKLYPSDGDKRFKFPEEECDISVKHTVEDLSVSIKIRLKERGFRACFARMEGLSRDNWIVFKRELTADRISIDSKEDARTWRSC